VLLLSVPSCVIREVQKEVIATVGFLHKRNKGFLALESLKRFRRKIVRSASFPPAGVEIAIERSYRF
jgi:hypothetical protein